MSIMISACVVTECGMRVGELALYSCLWFYVLCVVSSTRGMFVHDMIVFI